MTTPTPPDRSVEEAVEEMLNNRTALTASNERVTVVTESELTTALTEALSKGRECERERIREALEKAHKEEDWTLSGQDFLTKGWNLSLKHAASLIHPKSEA